ncbi:MAG TPA: hypothetical protein PK595_09185 [Bacteroidota bacterium]|nr:hypothetical protein [Bacteroidota bacterium]
MLKDKIYFTKVIRYRKIEILCKPCATYVIPEQLKPLFKANRIYSSISVSGLKSNLSEIGGRGGDGGTQPLINCFGGSDEVSSSSNISSSCITNSLNHYLDFLEGFGLGFGVGDGGILLLTGCLGGGGGLYPSVITFFATLFLLA